jgi:short subunit dehydrogenase-like uncharacterized protein
MTAEYVARRQVSLARGAARVDVSLARVDRRLRWAIAGRDRKKLEALRQRLSMIDPALAELSILIADSGDGAQLRGLVEQTTALCSAVGPYARHGSELVAACVDRGTHYCDISGESPWMRRMISEHHARAETRGVRIVHSCGYESIPSDLAVFALQQHARETCGAPSREVHALTFIKGCPPSGGSAASRLNLIEQAVTDEHVRQLLGDPFALTPEALLARGPARREPAARASQSGRHSPGYDWSGRVFTAPFLLAPSNVHIVHRSNALLDFPYGRDFSYREALPTGKGLRGAGLSLLFSASVLGVKLGLRMPPVRELLRRAAPKPGEGPSARLREGSFFAHELYGSARGKRLRARFASQGDPVHGETAKMLAESAFCLALDADRLRPQGGVLTAASALGTFLIERLRAAGISISAWSEGTE